MHISQKSSTFAPAFGRLPEWLGIGLQNRGQQFESATDLKGTACLAVFLYQEMEEIIQDITQQEYKYGFTTDVETDVIPRGLNEDVIRLISSKKNEPEWLLDFRLKAYRKWLTMPVPKWAHLRIPDIDFQAISYYAAPKTNANANTSAEIDPEIQKTFDKLGIPLEERAALAGNMAVDAVMDSVSVKTTFRETLHEKGILFCSISEAVREYPDLVRKYLGSVIEVRQCVWRFTSFNIINSFAQRVSSTLSQIYIILIRLPVCQSTSLSVAANTC